MTQRLELVVQDVSGEPNEVPQPAWKPAWGFGAKGADKAWRSPQEKPVPTDWWKKAA